MESVVDAGNADDPVTFARNELAVVVPAANEAGVASLADLERPDVLTAICAPDVPCGAATATLLAGERSRHHRRRPSTPT